MSPPKTALVTGANGYIGSAVAHAFSTAGYKTYGLIRSPAHAATLAAAEVTPIIGSAADLSFLPTLFSHTKTFDVIVSTTEDLTDYVGHFKDSIALFRAVAGPSAASGVRPLVIFTSGCKDYGMTGFDGTSGLQPHTETSPLHPPSFLRPRAENATRVFEHSDLVDAVVARPSTLYGRSGSYYAVFLAAADKAAADASDGGDGVLRFPADAASIMHGTHVSDCAAAYVAIAGAARDVVKGQVYNISSHRYETVKEVGEALKAEFKGIKAVRYTPGGKYTDGEFLGDLMAVGAGFSQWVGSEKLRKDTGWTDVRALFSDDVSSYRLAYEALRERRDGVAKVLGHASSPQ